MSVSLSLDGIDIFVKVIQTGSFTLAARTLKMPVTTVSGKIAALEKKLGITLIQRTTRKLHITEPGKVLYKRGLKALSEMQAAAAELDHSRDEPQGLLRITATVDFSRSVLFPMLQGFLKAYPKVDVELVLTDRVVDLVNEGVDLAFRIGDMKDSTLVAKRFATSTYGLWASPEYLKKYTKITQPKLLATHLLFKYPDSSDSIQVTNGKSTVEVPMKSRLIANDMDTLKTYVLNGDGIGFLPEFQCAQEASEGRLVRVLPQWHWSTLRISVVYPAQPFVPPHVRAFVEWASNDSPIQKSKL